MTQESTQQVPGYRAETRASLTRRFSVYSDNSELFHDVTTTQKGRYCSLAFTTFGNSKRSGYLITDNPGPGQYETLRKSFITPRPGMSAKPGKTDMKRGMAKTESRAGLQAGGASAKRGNKKPQPKKEAKKPRSTFGAPRGGAFANTFRGIADNPGPGTYDTGSSFTLGAQALRSQSKRSGATFGYSNRKFEKPLDNPGPGSYEVPSTIVADSATPWRNCASPVAYQADLQRLYDIFGYPDEEESYVGTVDEFLEEEEGEEEAQGSQGPAQTEGMISARSQQISARSGISQ